MKWRSRRTEEPTKRTPREGKELGMNGTSDVSGVPRALRSLSPSLVVCFPVTLTPHPTRPTSLTFRTVRRNE